MFYISTASSKYEIKHQKARFLWQPSSPSSTGSCPILVNSRFEGRTIKPEQACRILSWHNLSASKNLKLKDYLNNNSIFGITYHVDIFKHFLSCYFLNSTISCSNEFYRLSAKIALPSLVLFLVCHLIILFDAVLSSLWEAKMFMPY